MKIHQGVKSNLYYIVDQGSDDKLEISGLVPMIKDFYDKTNTLSIHKKNETLKNYQKEFVIEQLKVGHMKTMSKSAYVEFNQND